MVVCPKNSSKSNETGINAWFIAQTKTYNNQKQYTIDENAKITQKHLF